jgi:hypothetical protein
LSNKYFLEPLAGQKLIGKAWAGGIRLQTGVDPSNMDLSCGFDIPLGRYKIVELNLEIQVVSHDDNRYQFFTIK